MSEFLTCPASGRECDNASLCARVNEPLTGGIAAIRQGVETGVSVNLARHALVRELHAQLNLLGEDVPIDDTQGGPFSVRICPRNIIEGPLGDKLGASTAAEALHNIAQTCVEHATADLNR